MKKTVIAVIGCGLWGRNIVRNFYNLEALHTVCDLDVDNLQKVQEQYSGVNITSDLNEILSNPEITAVAVVTPSHTHFKLVKQVLECRLCGSVGREGDSGSAVALLEIVEYRHGVAVALNVNCYRISSCLEEAVDVLIGIGKHKVNVKEEL